MYLCGLSENSIDEKNRLAIPSKFRSQLDPEKDGAKFVISPGRVPSALYIYPERHFRLLVSQGESSLIPGEDQQEFDEIFFSLSEKVELDSQSRVLIPEHLLNRTGLGREVVIIGVHDHLEVRPREEFKQTLDEKFKRFREYQSKAREAYRQTMRQAGPEAGLS